MMMNKSGNIPKRKTGQAATTTMEQLPQEIIVRILSRLPVTSLLQSMSICRAWRSLIQDPSLVAEHFLHFAEKGYPTFIFQSNQPNSSYQLFFIDFSDYHNQRDVILKTLPYPLPLYLVDSCNGLLCMRDGRYIYIWNPFTRFSLELPKLTTYSSGKVGHINLGYHPNTKKYKVIQIIYERPLIRRSEAGNVVASASIQSHVHVLTIGDPAWRDLGLIPYDFARPTPKALVNGRLHWLSKPNKYTTASLVVSFDLETEQFNEVAKPDCCGSDRCFHNVMVLRGCLSAIAYHDKEQLEIWVMKEYGNKESWIKEFTVVGPYLPRAFEGNDLFHHNNARARFPDSSVKVLSILRNGDILLEYRNRALVVYNPRDGTFKELTFLEMPHWYKIVGQVCSLNWIDTPI